MTKVVEKTEKKVVERALWLDDGRRKKNGKSYKWYSCLVFLYNDGTNDSFVVELYEYPYLNVINERYKNFFNIRQYKGLTPTRAKRLLLITMRQWNYWQEEEAIYRKSVDDRNAIDILDVLKRRKDNEQALKEALKNLKIGE